MCFGDVFKLLFVKSYLVWVIVVIGDYYDFYLFVRRICGYLWVVVCEWSVVWVLEMDFCEFCNVIFGYVCVVMGEDLEFLCGVKWWVVLY